MTESSDNQPADQAASEAADASANAAAGAAATPAFAVVGHPNKGKSSIVATLAEDASVPVSPVPGTTTRARDFTFRLDGEPLYRLIDTPGFQRAREVLGWLQEHAASASDRAATVAAFVSSHADDPRFHDECELLRPLLAGAGILYVVDGSRPYGPEYEAEMEILRWSGQPRMALINPITSGNHIEEWQRALDQYFAIVRVFDAVGADFSHRVALLQAFGELREDWRPALQRAAEALLEERKRRQQRSASSIANLLVDTLSHTETLQLGEREASDRDRSALREQLQAWIRKRETRAFKELQSIYHHDSLDLSDSAGVLTQDVFDRETWEIFGLSRRQLLAGGALAGAATGALADAAVGGLSLFAGTVLGAAAGAASAWFGADNLAKVRVLGTSLGGRVLQVGPVQDQQFAWVLLGRALLHQRMVAERNHARREALALDAEAGAHLAGSLAADLRKALAGIFAKLAEQDDDSNHQQQLSALLAQALAADDPVS